jgi:N-acetylneuraminate synthase
MKHINFHKLEAPYLIGEIGINHNGDLQNAKRLIDAVFGCEWHCAKFQKRNPEKAVPEHEKRKPRNTPWGEMTYLEYKYRVEFGKDEYDYIHKYCDEKPVDWTVSVWDLDSLEFALNYNLPFIKIPSAMLTNKELIVETAKAGVPVLLSTGMSTIDEIDEAVKILDNVSKSYALMHCNSAYPAAHKDLHLRAIPKLAERYKCPVGYSGHEADLEPTVLAVSLGAKIIERHITLDHKMWGTDQSSSLEIHGMSMLRRRMNSVEEMMGGEIKIITDSEIPIRKKLRGV